MRVDFSSNLMREEADPRALTRSEVGGRLREFGLDHMDQFLLGALDGGDPLSHSPSIMEDVLDELARLRDEGKIRYAGFSCHDPDYAARLIETWPVFDAVMTPYNFVNRAAEGKLAEVLRTAGTAWIAMKPMVWHAYGLPVTALRNVRPVPGRAEHDPQAPIAALALQFILSNPLIATTVPSVNFIEAVDENTAASGCGQLTDEDDGEERAKEAGGDLLACLAKDAEWSPYIP
jgi:aryl-alcohol dehydrogenase-like predicted oxidoreductase